MGRVDGLFRGRGCRHGRDGDRSRSLVGLPCCVASWHFKHLKLLVNDRSILHSKEPGVEAFKLRGRDLQLLKSSLHVGKLEHLPFDKGTKDVRGLGQRREGPCVDG